MRVSDAALDEVRVHGFTVVEGFVDGDDLVEAQDALWCNFPHPDAYFSDPSPHESFSRSQFAGLRHFPFRGWAINRLAFHPDLVDAVERYLESSDLQLYKIELWAKYAGAIDYDQLLHRDFGNHSLVVPRADGWGTQLTTFILLSDVTEADGPTHVVPLEHSADVPLVPLSQLSSLPALSSLSPLPAGSLAEHEVAITGPAGTLFMYRTTVLHRGSNFTEPHRSRFALLADYQVRGPAWVGKMAWPNQALQPGFVEVMERASVRERDLFGFPRPGDPYWNAQTIADVGRRYPNMDMGPYV